MSDTCLKGHRKTPDNTLVHNGQLECLACHRISSRKWAATSRAFWKELHARIALAKENKGEMNYVL